MACSHKRLRDHLQYQQDPFVLRIYLSERRIVLNKVSMGQGGCKPNEKVSQARNTLKWIFDKFTSNSQRKQVSNNNKTHKDEFTSSVCCKNQASSLARISPDVKEGKFTEKQEAAGKNQQMGSEEDGKQLSSSSALAKVSSPGKDLIISSFFQANEEASVSSGTNGEKDDKISTIIWKLAVRFLAEKKSTCGFIEPQDTNFHCFLQLLEKKNALQSTRKLLQDCMHEAIDLHGKKLRRKKQDKVYISFQEPAKIICEEISSWCQENASEKRFDGSCATEDWNYLQVEKRKIAADIADAITDSIIQETIDFLIE